MMTLYYSILYIIMYNTQPTYYVQSSVTNKVIAEIFVTDEDDFAW